MEGNQLSAIQEGEEGKEREAGQTEEHQEAEIPDLALNLQEMSISAPRVHNLQATQVSQDPQIVSCYNLLLKVACTGGTPRSLSQQAMSQAMARAWRHHYHAISQVSSHLFMAHFTSQESMMFVLTRQPWTMGSDNLLIEWIDPADESKTKDDYKFEHIYVNVRVYGVPKNHRSLQLLQQILSTVGKPSEFHPLQESMLFARSDYIWGTTKIRITDSVVDKISLTLDEETTKMVYLYYEKIGRICLFCGVMFHTVQHCQKRNNIIMDRVRSGKSTEDVPFFRYGEWIMDSAKIPAQAIEKERAANPILSRFQKMFQEDYRGEKGKPVMGKADLHPRLSPMHNNYGQGFKGEFLMGQSSSTNNLTINEQHLRTSGDTFPTLTTEKQCHHERRDDFITEGMQESHLSQEVTIHNHPIQSVNTGERQFKGTEYTGILGTISVNKPRIQDFDMEDLPSSQLHQSLLLKRATPDGANKILQHQIDVGQGNTENAGEIHDYVMHTEATSGEEREKGKDVANTGGEEEARDNRARHQRPVREAEVVEPRGGKGGGEGGNQIQQYAGRPSGWDVPLPEFDILGANLHGAAVFGAGSVTDRHSYSSRKMGVGPSARRNKRQTVGHMGRPYPLPCKKDGLVVEPIESDPIAYRLPCASSPDSSENSFSSRTEVYSPSHTVDYHCTGLNASYNTSRAGTLNSFQGDSEPTSNIHGDTVAVSESLRDENMDLDRAMVPAHKAPRAP